MTRTSVQFYSDRPVTPGALADAIAQSLQVPHESIVAVDLDDEVAPHWFAGSGTTIGVQTRSVRGDFRSEIVVMSDDTHDYVTMIKDLAANLHVAILTDEFEVESLLGNDWTLVTPDGRTSTVFTNDDATDADRIILDQMSHKVLETRMAHAAD